MATFLERIRLRRIDGKYSVMRKLGEGGYGLVYLGKNLDTGSEVALKMEHRELEPSVLAQEFDQYNLFRGQPGFPTVHWHGWQDDYKVIVMELLGPNLEDLFVFCGRRFGLKTTLMVVDQLLARLETLHAKGLLHRDIKPQNFLMGTGKQGNTIYMTDFGLVQEFEPQDLEDADDTSPPFQLVGTARFASIRAHTGDIQSPWDDLESLGYMVIYFLKGRLPWQGLKTDGSVDKYSLIMEKKKTQNISELCAGLPSQFAKYLQLVRNPERNKLPDHAMLKKLFRDLAKSERIEFDYVYDWTERLYLQQDHPSL